MYNEEKYNEINRQDGAPSRATFAFLLVAVVVYLFIGAFPIPLLVRDIVLMAALVIFVSAYIKGHITEYEYVYDEDILTINSILGGRVKSTMNFDINNIVSFRREYDPKVKPQHILCVADSRRYTAVFRDGDSTTRVVFAPSDVLVDIIDDRIMAISKEGSK